MENKLNRMLQEILIDNGYTEETKQLVKSVIQSKSSIESKIALIQACKTQKYVSSTRW